LDGAGERGKTTSSGEKTGVGGTRTGKVVVEGEVMAMMLIPKVTEMGHSIVPEQERAGQLGGPQWYHEFEGCE
jgi:hypothetical protein